MSRPIAVYKNAVNEMGKSLAAFDSALPYKKQLGMHKEFMEMLWSVAIGAVVIEVDCDKFARNLMRAAENAKSFIKLVKNNGNVMPLSVNQGLLSALAINHFDFAVEIAKSSTTDQSRNEYDDEYYAALFIRELVLQLDDSTYKPVMDLQELCDKTEDYLEKPSLRNDFYRAVLANDAAQVQEIFIQWVEFLVKDYADKESRGIGHYWDSLNRRIWVEGLALMNLMQRKGFAFEKNYTLIPKMTHGITHTAVEQDVILGQTNELPETL